MSVDVEDGVEAADPAAAEPDISGAPVAEEVAENEEQHEERMADSEEEKREEEAQVEESEEVRIILIIYVWPSSFRPHYDPGSWILNLILMEVKALLIDMEELQAKKTVGKGEMEELKQAQNKTNN